MARINLLDTQTANLIAAGEVVERPANVLKELLENAIDAGATSIVTEIRGGGIDWIRVTDNGMGMEKEDLPLCIRRHATSKIRVAEDLNAIATLGFRGEALAAISSTSRFTMMSKRREDAVGHQMTVEGEEILSLEEAGCADGTTVIVKDLFFNQPARKKFLKRAQTEASAILQYLQRLAISHPEISFRHSSDGAVKLQTVGNGKLADCIYSVYGKEFFSALMELEYQEGPFTLRGYITRPELARNNHNYQFFYINSRLVKSRTMQFAVEDAYKSFVKSEKFPGCVLFLELDPAAVDVNVHPAKLEVRFEEERSVYNAVYQGVRKTLANLSNRLARDEYQRAVKEADAGLRPAPKPIGETRPAPTVGKEVLQPVSEKASFDLPLFSAAPPKKKAPLPTEEPLTLSSDTVIQRVTFADPEKPKAPLSEKTAAEKEPEKRCEPLPKKHEEEEKKETPPVPVQQKKTVPLSSPDEQMAMEGVLRTVREENPLAGEGILRGVLFNAYLAYESADCLYLIDKHAAHERILYEALKKEHREEATQLFLEPLFLSFTAMEAAALNEALEELNRAGFLLESFGETGFLLRGIPIEFVALSGDQIRSLMEETAKELALGGRAAGAGEKKLDRTLYSMACKAALKAGIASTHEDHLWIIRQLKEIDSVTVCPHGRPVLIPFTKKQIEALFLRT